jgi:hypothetical protein
MMRVFENGDLRKIFGSQGGKVTKTEENCI